MKIKEAKSQIETVLSQLTGFNMILADNDLSKRLTLSVKFNATTPERAAELIMSESTIQTNGRQI